MSGPDPHINFNHNVHDEGQSDSRPVVNPTQSQQLNGPQRCHACGNEVRQNIAATHDESVNVDGYLNSGNRMRQFMAEWDANEDDTDSVQGDEGLEEDKTEASFPGGHLVHLPGHGVVPLWAINQGLARHDLCTCLAHCHGGLPDDSVSGASTPGLARITSTSSMTVELSSGDISMQSSGYLPPRTPSPTIFELMGAWFRLETPIYYFTSGPLWLSPLGIDQIHSHAPHHQSPHPLELHIGEDDETDDDMWHTVRALPN